MVVPSSTFALMPVANLKQKLATADCRLLCVGASCLLEVLDVSHRHHLLATRKIIRFAVP